MWTAVVRTPCTHQKPSGEQRPSSKQLVCPSGDSLLSRTPHNWHFIRPCPSVNQEVFGTSVTDFQYSPPITGLIGLLARGRLASPTLSFWWHVRRGVTCVAAALCLRAIERRDRSSLALLSCLWLLVVREASARRSRNPCPIFLNFSFSTD